MLSEGLYQNQVIYLKNYSSSVFVRAYALKLTPKTNPSPVQVCMFQLILMWIPVNWTSRWVPLGWSQRRRGPNRDI